MAEETVTAEPATSPSGQPVDTALKDFGNLDDVFNGVFKSTTPKEEATPAAPPAPPAPPAAPEPAQEPPPAPREAVEPAKIPSIADGLLPSELFGEPATPKPAEKKEIPIPEGLTKPKDIATWKELRQRLDSAESDAEKYRTEAAEYRTKFETEQPDMLKTKLAETEQRAKELSERISVVDLRLHPEFQKQFDQPIDRERRNALDLVKMAGLEAGDLEQALRLPPGPQRTELLDSVVEGIRSPSTQAELGAILKELNGLERSRAGALSDAKGNWERLQEYDKAQRFEAFKEDQKRSVTMLRDLEKSFAEEHKIAFARKIEGNEEWNKQVDSESQLAHDVVTSGKDPQQLIGLVRLGTMVPRMYNTTVALRTALQKALAENAELKGADPSLNGGRETAPTESEHGKDVGFAAAVARSSGLR